MKNLLQTFTLLLLILAVDASAQDGNSNGNGNVYFNHMWVAIDTRDFDMIRKSEFINSDFGVTDFHSSKTESGDAWSGIYFYGTNNYIEFLDEQAQHIKTGSGGLGFSVDEVGELKQLKKKLHGTFGKHVHARSQTKLDGDNHIKWYQSIFVNDEVHFEDTTLYYWVLEYEKEIFEYEGIGLDPGSKNLTREMYLSQWEDERKDKLFQQVTGVTIDLHHREYETFSRFLNTVGFQKNDRNSYRGPEGFEIILEELDLNTPTITSIRMKLQNPVESDRILDFGSNTSLKLNANGTAEWVFR